MSGRAQQTGPEHYAEAERLMAGVEPTERLDRAMLIVEAAKAHAALAAIRYDHDWGHAGSNEGRRAWREFFEGEAGD